MALAELGAEPETPGDAAFYLSERLWLDLSDRAAARNRYSHTPEPARAAVEKLLATL